MQAQPSPERSKIGPRSPTWRTERLDQPEEGGPDQHPNPQHAPSFRPHSWGNSTGPGRGEGEMKAQKLFSPGPGEISAPGLNKYMVFSTLLLNISSIHSFISNPTIAALSVQVLKISCLSGCKGTVIIKKFYNWKVSSARSQYTRSTHKTQSHFSLLVTKMWKPKL